MSFFRKKKEIEALNLEHSNLLKQNTSLTNSYNSVNEFSLFLNYNFLKTDNSIERVKSKNLEFVSLNNTIKEYIVLTDKIKKGIDVLNHLEESFNSFLKEIRILSLSHAYRDAIRVIKDFDKTLVYIDLGMNLKTQLFIEEILAWEMAKMYDKMAKYNIKKDIIPLVNDEIHTFYNLVVSLPTNLHSIKQKETLINNSLLYWLKFFEDKALTKGDSFDFEDGSLDTLIEAYNLHENIRNQDLIEEKEKLNKALIEAYNKQCHEYFDTLFYWDKSLVLFKIRPFFDKELLTHEAFIKADTIEEFEILFIMNSCLHKPRPEFFEEIKVMANIPDKTSGMFNSLGYLLANEELEDTKYDMLLKIYSRLSFEDKIRLYSSALNYGINLDKEKKIVENICKTPIKIIDLAGFEDDLFNIKQKRNEKLGEETNDLLKDLLRSHKARKYILKSNRGNLNKLIDKEEENRSVGKSYNKSVVRALDIPMFVGYYTISFVIFASLGVFSFIYPASITIGNLERHLFYSIPFIYAALFSVIDVGLYHGRDEIASFRTKKWLLVISISLALFSLVCFITNERISLLGYIGYPALVVSFSCLLLSLVFKSLNKKQGGMLVVFALISLVATIVVMSINLSNGILK